MVHLSTAATQKHSAPPWVIFRSARWVNIGSAPTAEGAGISQTVHNPGTGTAVQNYYAIGDATNTPKRKSLGVVIRPKTKEVFWTTGDPDDGAGVIGYSRGYFVDFNAPVLMQVVTKLAAQRSLSLNKIHLRLSSY